MHTITRRLEMDAGHRLMGHESKCRNVHGHRYVFEITCQAEQLDVVGRVIDFGVIKQVVGGWIDDHWDHGFIYETGDSIGEAVALAGNRVFEFDRPPTAENMADVLHELAQRLLADYGIEVVNVRCHETPNCYADSRAVTYGGAAIDRVIRRAQRRADPNAPTTAGIGVERRDEPQPLSELQIADVRTRAAEAPARIAELVRDLGGAPELAQADVSPAGAPRGRVP